MQASQQLHFLQQKIQEFGHALFFNLSDCVLKFPSALVANPTLDAYGYLWFWVPKPKQEIGAFENGFPVRLDFYRKGANGFMQVTGMAWIVTDPEELLVVSQLPALSVDSDRVLVKVKLQYADYHEQDSVRQQSWWGASRQHLFSWLRQSSGGYAETGSTLSVS